MSTTKKSKIPKFKNEDQERDFWSGEDSQKYIDWSKAKEVTLPSLRPTLRSISLRLPESLLEKIKSIAIKNDVPYQSLMKIFLSEKVDEVLARQGASGSGHKKSSSSVKKKSERNPGSTQ